MKISIIAVNNSTVSTQKGSYQKLEVTYRNLDKNKVESKYIMSFTKPDTVFKTLVTAKGGDVFEVTLVKNEQSGYWDWSNAERSVADAAAPGSTTTKSSGGASATAKGGWETPEERKAKQVYIIRQSSISAAVSALTAAGKVVPKPEEVIQYAKELEAYVLDTGVKPSEVAAKDITGFEGFTEDLPF